MQFITSQYLELQKLLHKNQNYGVASKYVAPLIDDLIDEYKIDSLCDYGAGKQVLKKCLTRKLENYYPYDPVFPEYGEATKADLVCCIDVLEHIEPSLLDNVLDHLQELTIYKGFFTIHTGAAAKVLADGRNAHLIQMPIPWWEKQLKKRFLIDSIHQSGMTIYVYVSAMKPLR